MNTTPQPDPRLNNSQQPEDLALLGQSEQRLQLALEATNLAVYEWDLVSDRLTANERFRELLGIGSDEVILGARVMEHLVHPQDRAHVDPDLARAMASGATGKFVFEHRLNRSGPLGEPWVLSHGQVFFAGPEANRLPSRVFGTLQDITERKRQEQQQAFLLILGDALRPLSNPVTIEGEVTQLLRAHFDAGWCYYVEWDEATKRGLVRRDAAAEGLASLMGEHDVSDVGEFLALLKANPVLAVSDYETYEQLTPALRQRYTSLGFRSMLVATLVKQERLVASLLVGDTKIRPWSTHEAALLMQVAERTWAAIERANAEKALRESEEKYRTLFTSIDDAFFIIELINNQANEPVDYRLLEANPAFEQATGIKNAVGKLGSEYSPDSEGYWLDTFDRVARTGESLRFENYHAATDRWYQCYYTRNGGVGSRQVAAVFNNITERKRQEQRQEFLLKLSDALRLTANATEIEGQVTRLTREYLGTDRCYYSSIENDHAIIRNDSRKPGLPSLAGAYPLRDFPILSAVLDKLKPYVADDVANSGFDRSLKELCLQLQILSFVAVPVIKHDTVVGTVSLTQSSPRPWQEQEITLIADTAERLWAAVERANAEEALRVSQQRFKSIANLVPDLLWESGPDGATNWYNQRWLAYTGQRFEEAIGWGWTQAIHPDDREASAKGYGEAVAAGSSWRQEHRIRRYDGAYRWFVVSASPLKDARGQVVTMYGAATDIHQSKLAQQALRQADERFRTFVNTAPVLLWETDANGLSFTNQQYLDFFGQEFNDLRQMGWARFLHPDDAAGYLATYQQAFVARKPYVYECRLLRADGHYRWLFTRGRPLNSHHFVGACIDITANKEAEAVRQEADRRKDEFLAMLAHELRNPMSTLRSGLGILDVTITDELTRSTVEMMDRQTDHLVRMVDDLLDVSRISLGKIALKKERVNLVEVVSQAAESVGSLYQEQGKRLLVDLPQTPIYLQGDATRLTQVAANLLTNGARYTGEQGQVWLSLKQQDGPALGGPRGRQEAILQVRDDGIGLAADQLSAIFELFVQVDNSTARSKGGLGLGLTLVKRLVELHDGRVEAQSKGLGQGSTFTVHLPTLAVVAGQAVNPSPQAINLATAGRILIIDDNADAGLMLTRLLKLKGYEAHTRTSGLAGLEAAERLQPGAVLLDIGMPGLDGYETCRLIRQQPWGQNIVVIALTGYGQEEDRQRTREAGFNGHLVKPVDVGALTTLLTHLLDKGQTNPALD